MGLSGPPFDPTSVIFPIIYSRSPSTDDAADRSISDADKRKKGHFQDLTLEVSEVGISEGT
jgi:hypothetical protein